MIWLIILVIIILAVLIGITVYYVNRRPVIQNYHLEFKRSTESEWQVPMCFIGYTMMDSPDYIWANINNSTGTGWRVNTDAFYQANTTPQSQWQLTGDIQPLNSQGEPMMIGYDNGYFTIRGIKTKQIQILVEQQLYDIRIVPGDCPVK